jgi:hypothetical protein
MLQQEIVGPVDAFSLIVATRGEPEVQLSSPFELPRQQDVAAINLGAIRDDRVDLGGRVLPDAHSFDRAPAGIASDNNNVACTNRPLTLNAEQAVAKVEYQIAPPSFLEGTVDVDPDSDRSRCNLGLCDRSFPIRRRHVLSLENRSDANTACAGNADQAETAASSFGTSSQRSSSR